MRIKFFRSATVEGSGGSTPPAEAAPPPAPNSQELIAQDIRSIMDFDPFGPEEQDGQPPSPATTEATPPAPAGEQNVVGTPPTGAPAAAPTAPPPPPPPTPDQALREAAAALAQSAQQIPQVIREAQAPQAPTAPKSDEYAPRTEQGQNIDYGMVMQQIPDQLIQGIASENPVERKQAVGQLLGVAMHIAHRQAVAHAVNQLRDEFSRVMPVFVQEQIQSFQTQQEVFNDFYGAFPHLSNPAIRPIVQREAKNLAAQLGVRGWSEDFRQRLGEHVTTMLRQFAAPVTPPPPTQAPVMSGPSARPAMPPAAPQAQPWDDLF